MAGKDYGGKTSDEWIEVMANGAADKRGIAASNIADMLTNGLLNDDPEIFRAARAVAKLTHDTETSARVRAYGAIGSLCYWYEPRLSDSDAFVRQKAIFAMRAMITNAAGMPLNLVYAVPELVDAMLQAKRPKEDFDEVLSCLENEEKVVKGRHRDAVREVLEQIRPKMP